MSCPRPGVWWGGMRAVSRLRHELPDVRHRAAAAARIGLDHRQQRYGFVRPHSVRAVTDPVVPLNKASTPSVVEV